MQNKIQILCDKNIKPIMPQSNEGTKFHEALLKEFQYFVNLSASVS